MQRHGDVVLAGPGTLHDYGTVGVPAGALPAAARVAVLVVVAPGNAETGQLVLRPQRAAEVLCAADMSVAQIAAAVASTPRMTSAAGTDCLRRLIARGHEPGAGAVLTRLYKRSGASGRSVGGREEL